MNYYDPNKETVKSRRKLPHWEQDRCLCFVTFRLKDSIPKSKLADWNERRILWLKNKGIDLETSNRNLTEKLSDTQKIEYYQRFTSFYHELLDSGIGQCELRNPQNSKIVADALLCFDGVRYQMEEFIVMPNHIHLLVRMNNDWPLSKLLQSWKRYTAREINKRTQQTGSLWQREYYDHLVRNEQQFIRIKKYIKDNPKGLPSSDFIHYSRTDLQSVD